MNYRLCFGIIIALVVLLNILVGVHSRMKPPRYEKKPDFNWDSLDDGESHDRDG